MNLRSSNCRVSESSWVLWSLTRTRIAPQTPFVERFGDPESGRKRHQGFHASHLWKVRKPWNRQSLSYWMWRPEIARAMINC